MAGLYNFIGWILIILGFGTAFITIAVGTPGITILPAMGIAIGGLLAAAPFFTVAELLNRLTIMKDLQYQANETSSNLLQAQLRTIELLEARQG